MRNLQYLRNQTPEIVSPGSLSPARYQSEQQLLETTIMESKNQPAALSEDIKDNVQYSSNNNNNIAFLLGLVVGGFLIGRLSTQWK
jgi:hypothetical protein